MSRLQKKPPAHKRGHPTLQNMNFFYFCGSFLPSWIRIRISIQITDPDPMVRLNTDPIRIRIPDPDLDPQHWVQFRLYLHYLLHVLGKGIDASLIIHSFWFLKMCPDSLVHLTFEQLVWLIGWCPPPPGLDRVVSSAILAQLDEYFR